MRGHKTCMTSDLPEVCDRLNKGDETVLVRDTNKIGVVDPLLRIAKGPFTCQGGVLRGFSVHGVLHELKLGGDSGTTIYLRREGGDWWTPGMGSHVLEI